MDFLVPSALCHTCESIVRGNEFRRVIETLEWIEGEIEGYDNEYETPFWRNGAEKHAFHTIGKFKLGPSTRRILSAVSFHPR
jgi:hypothetical protein